MNVAWYVSVAVGALVAIAAVPALVALSGGMFSQRCARAFPEDGYKQELCIERLAKGESISGLKGH
jgi:hypothetical protein